MRRRDLATGTRPNNDSGPAPTTHVLGQIGRALAFYVYRPAAGDTHPAALRDLGNRLGDILHDCPIDHTADNTEHTWSDRPEIELPQAVDIRSRGISGQ